MTEDDSKTGWRAALRERGRAALSHRYMPVGVAALAVLLALPSLGVGWLMDDLYHRATLMGSARFSEFHYTSMDMFRFFDGDPERAGRMMDFGFVPWWAFKGMKASFWRPLTILTHWLDYQLWPEHAALMHAHSLLWFGGLVAAVAVLYRRIAGATWIAGLGALLYAIDDAHGGPVAWLANRNALLATFFGVCVLIAHDRWRRDGWRAGAVLAPLLLVASLLSAEAGIATCAYLVAHAIVVDRSPIRQRFLALVPYAAVVVVWRVVWKVLGYGVANMGVYIDPLSDPLRFGAAALERAPILLLGQWAGPPGELSAFLGADFLRGIWFVAVVFLGCLVALSIPLLRGDRTARFWCLGMLFAAVPVCATFPADRLLFFVGIGAMGLLAQILDGAFGRPEWRPRTRVWHVGAVSLGTLLVVVHVFCAPVMLAIRSACPMGSRAATMQLHVNTPMDGSVEGQDLILVNPPSSLHASYVLLLREFAGQPVPRRVRTLAPGVPSVTIRRTDPRTLVVRPKDGYLSWLLDRLFRSERCPMSVGERVVLTGVTIEVTALTDDGRPAEALFRFAVPLEDPSLRWLEWKDGEFVPFTPPPVGGMVEVHAYIPSPF